MLKRKPPDKNVRRVASIGTNSRSTIRNKNGRTIQCESFSGERKLTLGFDRDPTVKDYQSQPIRIFYDDSEGKKHSYVPDFMVWKVDGSIEIHEVTRSERRMLPNAQRREAGARKHCQKEGWSYVVHTEDSLPNDTEAANLLELYMFRPTVYYHSDVAAAVREKLSNGRRLSLPCLINEISQELGLPVGVVSPGLYHLLWHGKIETDLRLLIFIDGAPLSRSFVWLPMQEG
jgi:TnsA-like endonuclease N terminal